MWIPIALSRDVPRKATRAIILEGKELVIWRGESGGAQIWEDRCPHRGMRLSFGFVRGDSLNCLYHGWEYGVGASCQRIPAHPDLSVPASIKANAYASAETGGMIWVSFDEAPGLPSVFLAGRSIASLAIATTPETLFQLLDAQPTGGNQIIEATLEGVQVNIGWHVVGPNKLMLHAVALDPGNVESKVLLALHRIRADAEKKASA